MLEIDVTSDIDRVFFEIGGFFRDQIPFVTSQALNDTAFDIRRRVVESTWENAFTVRNRRFPGRIFRVTPKATKGSLEAIVQATLDYPWVADWLERQATGGTKKPAVHNWIAIPVQGARRNAGGSIPKGQKPLSLKNTFIRSTRDGKARVIIQRSGGETWVRYILVRQAQIAKTFRFEEDATETAIKVFPGHWSRRLSDVIRKSQAFT